MFGAVERERQPGDIVFHPMSVEEYNIPTQFGGQRMAEHLGTRPKHTSYLCGGCGKTTNGRVVCDLIRSSDGAIVTWCLCSCDLAEPTILIEKDGVKLTHLPMPRDFQRRATWPDELGRLYEEAAKAYGAGAYTATAMVCRKVLMACACHEGAAEGRPFAEYVDFITGSVLTFAKAKESIDRIRTIGNDANHQLAFSTEEESRRALLIATYVLDTIYSLPTA